MYQKIELQKKEELDPEGRDYKDNVKMCCDFINRTKSNWLPGIHCYMNKKNWLTISLSPWVKCQSAKYMHAAAIIPCSMQANDSIKEQIIYHFNLLMEVAQKYMKDEIYQKEAVRYNI